MPIDYIGLSVIYSTPTKSNTKRHWGIEGLKMALRTTSLPIVAIGGINETNIPALSATGFAGLRWYLLFVMLTTHNLHANTYLI